jgi:hypothetical protein
MQNGMVMKKIYNGSSNDFISKTFSLPSSSKNCGVPGPVSNIQKSGPYFRQCDSSPHSINQQNLGAGLLSPPNGTISSKHEGETSSELNRQSANSYKREVLAN